MHNENILLVEFLDFIFLENAEETRGRDFVFEIVLRSNGVL